jgi:hypothetical protein
LGAAIGFSYLFWPTDKLIGLSKQIDAQVSATYETGQNGKIFFIPDEEGVMLVVSPPYARISDLRGNIFDSTLLNKMQSYVDSAETGHLFYIKKGHLIDHRLLSERAAPILGKATGKEVVFQVSRQPTSGRPVRIEIMGQQ